jgi:hypothetical protein
MKLVIVIYPENNIPLVPHKIGYYDKANSDSDKNQLTGYFIKLEYVMLIPTPINALLGYERI